MTSFFTRLLTPHTPEFIVEVTSVAGYPLPPQNHHQHTPAQGAIVWQLRVAHGVIQA
jgi:hypothetical protein